MLVYQRVRIIRSFSMNRGVLGFCTMNSEKPAVQNGAYFLRAKPHWLPSWLTPWPSGNWTHIPSGKLTVYYWKQLIYLFKIVIFRSYVSLPESIWKPWPSQFDDLWTKEWHFTYDLPIWHYLVILSAMWIYQRLQPDEFSAKEFVTNQPFQQMKWTCPGNP